MANSGYISKNIDSEQLRFLNLLEESEIQYFRISEIEKRLQTNFKNINEVVENLEHKKQLKRIERGKYVRKTFSNINALACFVCDNGAIGYWSALHYHGLTDRFPSIVFIKKTGRKKDTEIDRVKISFISVKSTKMIGLQREGYGENSFLVTDQELTIIDCIDLPEYAGDFDDLLRAFAKITPNENKLINYCMAYSNIALTKRLGYLAEFFHPKSCKNFILYAKSIVNDNYDLFYTGSKIKSKTNKTWKLRINFDIKLLEQIASDIKTK
jgi:predicted transcriptional regulator of viral defense system